MKLPTKSVPARILLLAGASVFALSAAVRAQEAAEDEDVMVLGVITLVSDGKDNVAATGGTEITAEDLERLKPNDLTDLFIRESSVAVSGGGGGASKKVNVLGVEQSLLATTIDGVPQAATAWHHTGSSVVDPAFLKAVKIEAGAAAADSGFGAAAGALRYETVGALDMLKDGQTVGGRVGLSFGNNGRGATMSLAGYGQHQSFDWFVMVNGAKGKDYKDGDGDVSLGTKPSGRNGLAKFGYETEGHRFELGLEHSRDDADRLAKANLSDGDNDLHPLKITRNTAKLTYKTTAPTDTWNPEVTLYSSSFEYWRNNYSPRNNGDAVFDENQFGGKVQNVFDVGVGQITVGLDFNKHDYKTYGYDDGNSAGVGHRYFSTKQIGAFAQGRFEFSNGVKLSTGARFDYQRFDDWNQKRFSGNGTSVNATLSYAVNDNIEIFAGASDTWLGYVVGDYGYVHARGPSFYTDPNLQPGKAKNYKLGANFGGDNWQAGVTLFDTKINNLLDYSTQVLVKNNAAEFRSKGFTLNGRYNFGDTQVGISYTKADVTADGVLVPPSNGIYFAPIGEQATIYVDHRIASWETTIGFSAKWAGSVAATSNISHDYAKIDSYAVVDAYAEWTPAAHDGLSVRFGIDNLFDRKYSERSGFGTGVRRSNNSVQGPVYAPGRTFLLNASMKF